VTSGKSLRIVAGIAADARHERREVSVTIADGRIAGMALAGSADDSAADIYAPNAVLVPGFIDIHIHGGAGRNVMEGTAEALNAISVHLARHGVTGFLSTTVTALWEEQIAAIEVADRAMRDSEAAVSGAAVLGVHVEGPYINPKRKGAQPEQYIRRPSPEDFEQHVGGLVRSVRVVTLAPEMPGGLETVRYLAAQGVIASIGHSDATYEEVRAAIDAGARHTTHTFNAMRQMQGRDPGVAGAAMGSPELACELIWDNVHVHSGSCHALIAAKGFDRMIFISDGIPGAGMPDNYQFSLGDLKITVRDGQARLPDGTLAGSVLTMDRAFQNAAVYTLSQRAAMTSFNAATALGLGHRKGLIAPGYDADLALLGPDGVVQATIVGGEVVYRAEG
jgi:N-acetylglucosamine-6-phosphate deacetylase